MSKIRVDNITDEEGTGSPNIIYDNAASGLTATSVQGAIDEVSEHPEELGGIHGIPVGERALHTDDLATEAEHEAATATDKVANPAGVRAALQSIGLSEDSTSIPWPNDDISDWTGVPSGLWRTAAGNSGANPSNNQSVNLFLRRTNDGDNQDRDGALLHFPINSNGDPEAWLMAGRPAEIGKISKILLDNGGGVIGDPSGGRQGSGTFNAEELYDNGNRVQTDYVFDAFLDGQIDYDHYDTLMGTRWVESETETETVEEEEEVTEECEDYREEWDEKQQAFVRRKCTTKRPVYDNYPVKDEDGNQIGVRRVKRTRKVTKYVPKQVEVQDEHKPAKRYEFDDLDPDAFWQKCQKFRKLPAFKRCEDNLREGQERPSTGQISQALTETAEDMAVHIHELHERVKALEGKK